MQRMRKHGQNLYIVKHADAVIVTLPKFRNNRLFWKGMIIHGITMCKVDLGHEFYMHGMAHAQTSKGQFMSCVCICDC